MMQAVERHAFDHDLPSVDHMVALHEAIDVAAHPLFVNLRRMREVDLGTIWLIMANLQAGISRDFVGWLARTIERVPDRRIGSLLAKQLNDELGAGNADEIHSVLLQRFVDALAKWRPDGVNEGMLAPGRQLGREFGARFQSREPYEGVGALVVSEIFASKMDNWLAAELRRQTALAGDALVWLELHETLEANHAGDSLLLARLVPDSGDDFKAAWRGAQLGWKALIDFLDALEAVRLKLRTVV